MDMISTDMVEAAVERQLSAIPPASVIQVAKQPASLCDSTAFTEIGTGEKSLHYL
jgi:hypothetical protein